MAHHHFRSETPDIGVFILKTLFVTRSMACSSPAARRATFEWILFAEEIENGPFAIPAFQYL